MNSILSLIIAIILGIIGQTCLKLGANAFKTMDLSKLNASAMIKIFSTPTILAGVILYGLSSVFWILTLTKEDLSFAYPMLAISYVAITLISVFLFNEKITMLRGAGIALVTIGAILIGAKK